MDTQKFHEIFRIESTRLINWDYSRPGWYFITICTQNKQKYFGNIINEKMQLSQVGEIAKKCWVEIPKHFENCKLREFVVMPNHVHGVIDIKDENWKSRSQITFGHIQSSGVETLHATSLRTPTKLTTRKQFGDNSKFYSLISPKPKTNISTIIRSFKSAVSKFCHDNYMQFFWQPRFYDHVIRDEYSLYFIEEYIRDNPENWNKDPLNIKIDWSKVKIEIR